MIRRVHVVQKMHGGRVCVCVCMMDAPAFLADGAAGQCTWGVARAQRITPAHALSYAIGPGTAAGRRIERCSRATIRDTPDWELGNEDTWVDFDVRLRIVRLLARTCDGFLISYTTTRLQTCFAIALLFFAILLRKRIRRESMALCAKGSCDIDVDTTRTA